MTIEKGKIGVEDVEFGTGTFTRKGKSGTLIPISKVSAVNIPITDSGSKFTGTEIEAALQECLVENSDGSSAKDYTNKSGSSRVAGDVVIVDIDNDESFELTTTLGDTKVLGVVAETIANNAVGKVITNGYVTTVTVDGVTARGSFLRTSATSGKASPSSTFVLGCFAIALKASVGPGVVSAYIFGSVSGNYLALTGGYLTGIVGTAVGANVASASAMTVGDDGNFFDITGTTGINTIGTKGVGTIIWLRFQDILTLTHSTDLVLPGSTNYITIAGDILAFIEYQTGDWRCISLISAGSGITGTGKEVKQVSPTLTTPNVDTINEATGTNGVTIDGLNIKDSKLNTNDSVITDNITDGAVTNPKASGLFGTWITNKVVDTNYLAATDLIVCANGDVAGTVSGSLTGYTNSATPPTTLRTVSSITGGAATPAVTLCITFPVKKGDYWKVTVGGTVTATNIDVLPLGG